MKAKKKSQYTIRTGKLFNQAITNFPVVTRRLGRVKYVNLDNAATTPPLLSVQKAVDDYLVSYGSVHRGAGTKSIISTDIYENTREVIKKFLNAPDDNYIIFTGNTTGAMNTLAYYFSFIKGKIAVSNIEHSSSWLPWIKSEGMANLTGRQVDYRTMLEINKKIQDLGNRQVLQYEINQNYEFDLEKIERLLQNNNIKALVLTAASNVTGYCPDIKKIGRLAHKYGAHFVVDACQFVQHHQIDMKESGIDFLAASGHKFYAPYGGGFLIGPKKFFDHFLPYQIGGGNLPYITSQNRFLHYENQLTHDPGTPNAVGAVAMAAALAHLQKIGLNHIERYEKFLATLAYDELEKNDRVKLFVGRQHLSNVIPFAIEGMPHQLVAQKLNDDFGIGIRSGSFCVYNLMRNFHDLADDRTIIEEVKKGNTAAIPGIARASFGLSNSEADAKRFIQAINQLTK